GQHKGLPFYTIGQRGGLGVAVGTPLYVKALETQTNTLVVGGKEDVLADSMIVRQVSWVSGQAPEVPRGVKVKIRPRHAEPVAILSSPRAPPAPLPSGEGAARPGEASLMVRFQQPQSAVTPGQAAVFYNGDIVLGGGVIDRAI